MRSSADKIIEFIAREEHTSPDEILRAMQEAMDAGLSDPSPDVQAAWKEIPHAGDKPTSQELILYLTQKLKSKS